MTPPSVTVCVPTYNGAEFLARTIDSVLAQTHTDFELIVVDDASTDSTAAVVGRYRDPRLRYVRHGLNRGAAETWNHAVELARAPLVKLLCHDDTIAPTCLAKQLPPFADPRVVLVTCWRQVIGRHGNLICVRRGMGHGRAIPRAAAVRGIVRTGTNLVGEPSATVFRKQAWAAVGGFSGANLYMIDIDLWLKLLRHGVLAFVPQTLCAYRISPTALSTMLARHQVAAGRRFLRELVDDPANGISAADASLGIGLAILRSWGRQVLYVVLGRRDADRRGVTLPSLSPAPPRAAEPGPAER